jgi:hypothetical protein
MTTILLSLCLAQPPVLIDPPPAPPPPVIIPPSGPPVLPPSPFPPGPPVVERLMTIDELARCFVPLPGTHTVTLLNPVTGCPSTVSFTLPDCPLRSVSCGRRSVTFDYGRHEVMILFRIRGRADVLSR